MPIAFKNNQDYLPLPDFHPLNGLKEYIQVKIMIISDKQYALVSMCALHSPLSNIVISNIYYDLNFEKLLDELLYLAKPSIDLYQLFLARQD